MKKTQQKKVKKTGKGWNTSDEDEIEVRKKRALKEEFTIVNLQKREKIFSSFKLQSKINIYLIELRSLEENINSCSCPDIKTNRLGTCKHIEAVKLLYKESTKKNRIIEIFLDTIADTIKILFPKNSRKKSYLRDELEQYFSESGDLLYEPTVVFKSLIRTIDALEQNYRNKIRVSRLIEPWLKIKSFELEKIENKKVFLSDYKNGKRSFEFLKHSLYDYQKEGVLHLAFTERALLADDMGLGKTIQAIGASVLLKKLKNIKKVLIISPASLKAEWEEQIEKFTDEKTKLILGSRKKREEKYSEDSFFYLANYEQILYDFETINTILQPDIIILDEAQRIKNWQTKTANSIKKLQSRYAFVLTGTPIENRIDEIYSIIQFLDPNIFGPLFRFNRDFYKLDTNGMAIGYKNMNLLHKKLQPIMLRRKKSDLEGELPPRVDKTYLVNMSQSQQVRYDEYETIVSRLANKAKKYPLSFDEMKKLQMGLACMRILCDSAYILDQKITISPKVDEVVPIIEELLEDKSSKIIIFSEWEKMLQLLNFSLKQQGIKVAWHTGSLDQKQRREEIKKFKQENTHNILLSTDSGSVGLNLQVANVVINLDMPWNPAKLEQRIARAWRKYQAQTVQVINFITQERLEHRIVEIVKQKQFLSDNVLDGLGQDELKLPSSRKEFLEDLEKIIQNHTPTEVTQNSKTEFNAHYFTQDLLSLFSDRIELISHNAQNNSLFVVIDKKDESIQSKIADNRHIKLLDKEEYELLKKLAEQGMIELKGDLETLYTQTTEKKPSIDTKTLIKIKEQFKNIKRKYDMAKLLHGGGFVDESLPVYKEMLENSYEVLELLKDASFDKDFLNNAKDNKELDSEEIVATSDKIYTKLNTLIDEL